MKIARTERFKKSYRRLSPADRELVKKALRPLMENPRHPGLRVKRIKGTAGIWEARVSRSCRMTFEIRGDTYLLRNVGKHDETLKNP